jgi:hypothetical protein
MKAIPIAQYLSQLEREPAEREPGPRLGRRDPFPGKPRLVTSSPSPKPSADPPPALVPDVESRIAEAYERGVQDGGAEANAEHAKRQAAQEADYESSREKAFEAFRAHELAQFAEMISTSLTQMEERIALTMARIMKPYLLRKQMKLVFDALCEDYARLRSSDAPPLLRVSGRESVLGALRNRLAGQPIEIEYSLNENVEVTVLAAHTRIQTQLQAWTDAINAIDDEAK